LLFLFKIVSIFFYYAFEFDCKGTQKKIQKKLLSAKYYILNPAEFLPIIVPIILLIFGHKGSISFSFGQINTYIFSQKEPKLLLFG